MSNTQILSSNVNCNIELIQNYQMVNLSVFKPIRDSFLYVVNILRSENSDYVCFDFCQSFNIISNQSELSNALPCCALPTITGVMLTVIDYLTNI